MQMSRNQPNFKIVERKDYETEVIQKFTNLTLHSQMLANTLSVKKFVGKKWWTFRQMTNMFTDE